MASLEEVTQDVMALTTALTDVDAKLDEIKAFILSLQTGGPSPVTQEQFDALAALITDAKAKSQAVLVEADALDE